MPFFINLGGPLQVGSPLTESASNGLTVHRRKNKLESGRCRGWTPERRRPANAGCYV